MACNTVAGILTCHSTRILTETSTTPVITTIQSTFTTTRQIVTTCEATPGQTLTISPPIPPWSLNPTTTLTNNPTPSIIITTLPPTTFTETGLVHTTPTYGTANTLPAPTITIVEIILAIQDNRGDIFTTMTVLLPTSTATLGSQISPTPFTVVVGEHQGSGWDTWSDAQKGGLIAGCVVIFLFLVFLVLRWSMRSQAWVQHDWSVNSHPGYVSAFPVSRHRGMRGGGGRSFEKGMSIRRWFGKRKDEGKNEMTSDENKMPEEYGPGKALFYQPPPQH